jgi:hypothetical protein
LLAWAFVGAVLNACWSSSDAAPEEWRIALERGARQLQTLLR